MLRKRSASLCLAALGLLTIGTVAAVSARPQPQEYPQPTAEHAMLLKGVGIEIIYPQLIALAIFAVVVMVMAARRLRKDWA